MQQGVEAGLALREGLVEKKRPVLIEHIESDEEDGNVGMNEKVEVFAAKTFLEFGEREGTGVLPGQNFAVEDELAMEMGDRRNELREFDEFVACARKQANPTGGVLVDLSADAVVFFFDEESGGV